MVATALAIRSSIGIELWASLSVNSPLEPKHDFPREETKHSRSMSFSSDGCYFAYTNGNEIKVLQTSNWQEKCRFPRPKAFFLKFSPRGNYLCSWEQFAITKNRPEGEPNLHVFELQTSAEVFSTIQKKTTDWEPVWSTDESIFAMIIGGEIVFYDLSNDSEGFKSTAKKIGGSRGGALSLGPGNSPPFLAIYTPGSKGGPSMCKLYKYPALAQSQTIACKSFFQADHVDLLWNKRGTGLLILTSTEVDKSGASYYGNQALHFMSIKGDSCSVPLSKEGPVHCVKWSPKATEFVVVYGYMPSKAALYNLKCDVIYDFGEGPRNCAYFNDFGNLLVLAGFGNLPGNIEVWDIKKKEKITNFKAPDTTYFEWSPNGETFLTATTAPRLRMGNGFKVWHYSGALLHETIWPENQQLLGLEWQRFPEDTFPEPVITNVKVEGIKSAQPEASVQVYQPPNVRLMKQGKNPNELVPQPSIIIPEPPAGNSQSKRPVSKPSRQKTKAKKDSNTNLVNCVNLGTCDSKNRQTPKKNQKIQPIPLESSNEVQADALNKINNEDNKNDDNKNIEAKKLMSSEKKLRLVAKKLSDIKKLKARKDQGETLELNQLNKISMEAKFLEELKSLKLSM